jgi:hypothetical protein
MATFTIDLLTGLPYLFNNNFSGGTTSGTTYPQVAQYIDLPSPASSYAGDIYVVRQPYGTYMTGIKDAGLYWSNNINWVRLGDITAYFNSDNFQVFDDTDNTKGLKFITSGFTGGATRYATFKDKNGVVVYQEEINTYTGTTAPNTFLRLNQTSPQKVFGGTPIFPSIQYNLTGATATAVGKLQWSPDDLTLEFGVNSDVTLQIGQEEIVRVVNKSGAPMHNGQLVVISGASGNKPAVVLANASNKDTAFKKILMLTQDIGNNNNGFATSSGLVHGLNTFAYSAGTRLYLSTTGGSWTNVPPPAPAYTVPVAVVTYEHINQGVVLVFTGISPLPRLEDLSDVNGTPLTSSGQFPIWNNVNKYFDFTANINDYVPYSAYTGLQGVTEVGASTNIESTFNSGLVTNKIRPTGDTINALQVTKANGTTAVINVDTVSGFTGFGTTTPDTLINIYGTDIKDSNPDLIQTNALRIDGLVASDKEIQWVDNNTVNWVAGTYRNENARYWYLYNQDTGTVPIVASSGGRIGINSPSNIVDYHPFLISGGTDDLKLSGTYDKYFTSLFQVKINSIGVTDTFIWRVSYDKGVNYGSWSSSNPCTTGITLLESGVYVTFENVSGHILNTMWGFAAFSQLPTASLTVHPNGFNEILLNPDYTLNVDNYIDETGTLSTSDNDMFMPIFNAGNTNAALYVGSLLKFNTTFFHLHSYGAGITLITEYWNGSSWVDISIGNPFYLDGTNDLTKNGNISWNSSSMSGWIKAYLPNRIEEGYDLYWVRFRTASIPSAIPYVQSVMLNGDKRISIFSAELDYNSKFFVDAIGRTSIGGGTITGNNVLQISENITTLDVVGASPSLVEIDSVNADAVDLKMRLVTDDACGSGFVIAKSRGTLDCSTNVMYNDKISHICSRATVNNIATTLSQIETIYKGNGTTAYGDMMICTPNGSVLTEKIRVSAVGTGFGEITPTAIIHIQSGTTTLAPLKFTSGNLLSSPQIGAVEFNNDAWYGTITSSSARKTFAFLESPQFTGNVNLPSTTCLNSVCLNDIIAYSGGTLNPLVVTHDEFNPYSAATESILNVIYSGATNGVTNYDDHYIKLGGTLTENTIISATTYSLNFKGYHVDLSNGDGDLKFRINNNSAVFTDSRTGSTAGIEYANNYHAGFATHSLVDKAYVDSLAGGLTPKEAVNVATTGNINLLSAPASIDGITMQSGYRVLVKDQTSGATNGIYDYNGSGSAMTRSTDFDGTPSGEVVQNAYAAVLSGSTNSKTSWILATPNPITVGVTSLYFTLYSQTLGILAGNGIKITPAGGNNVIAVKLPTNSALLADGSGLYVDSSIAGNSLTWNSGVINVNISGGTLSTALNSKLNTSEFNTYSGNTLNDINSRVLTSTFTGYTASTASSLNSKLNTSIFNYYTGTTAPNTYVIIPVYSGYTAQTKTILNSKAYLSGATFTGAIYAPTATPNTSTSQVATTCYVVSQASTTTPLMDKTAAIGTCLTYARADHRHPSNTYGTSNGQVLFNCNGALTGCTGFYMSGGTLYVPNVEVNGVGSYHYGDRLTTLATSSITPIKYYGYTASTFTTGTYQIDINTRQGNLSNGKCTGVRYLCDGVIQSTFENAASFGGAQWSEFVTRDILITAGTHCIDIQIYALGGGTSCACMARGVIRLRKIC